jgi:single-strand DNA-binding protein
MLRGNFISRINQSNPEETMAGVNKVILIGNLGKDPELRYTPAGQPVATFSLATTERRTDKSGQRKETTEWHNIVVFGKTAEIVNQYLKKGRSCYLEGKITTRSWDDRDGNKKYKTEIIANTVQFLGGGGGASGGAPTTSESVPSADAASSAPEPEFDQTQTASSEPASAAAGASDDLPF